MPKARFARTGGLLRVPEIKPNGIYSRRNAARALQIGEKRLTELIDAGELKSADTSARGDSRLLGRWILEWLESKLVKETVSE